MTQTITTYKPKKKKLRKALALSFLALSTLINTTSCFPMPDSQFLYFIPALLGIGREWFAYTNRGRKPLIQYHFKNDSELEIDSSKNNYKIDDVLEPDARVYEPRYTNLLVRMNEFDFEKVEDKSDILEDEDLWCYRYEENTDPLDPIAGKYTYYFYSDFYNYLDKETPYYQWIHDMANKEQEFYNQKYDLEVDEEKRDSLIYINENEVKRIAGEIYWTRDYSAENINTNIKKFVNSFRTFTIDELSSEEGTEVGCFNSIRFKTKEKIKINSISFDIEIKDYLMNIPDYWDCYNIRTIRDTINSSIKINHFDAEDYDYYMDFCSRYDSNMYLKWSWNGGYGDGHYASDYEYNSQYVDYYVLEDNPVYAENYTYEELQRYYLPENEKTHFDLTFNEHHGVGLITEDKNCVVLDANQTFLLEFDFIYNRIAPFTISNFNIDFDVVK